MYEHEKNPQTGPVEWGRQGMDDKSGHIIDRSTSAVNTNSPYSDIAQEILRSISILQRQGEVRELALADPQVKKHRLWGGTFAGGKAPMICGWYQDLQKMVQDATEADEQAKPVSIYVTLNPASDALLGRANERLKASADRTQDVDIIRRTWFYIDLDPKRPKGISSTDAEKQAASELAWAARDYFIEQGWPDPVLGDSGNGFHLLFQIDLSNDEASRDLIKACLQAAAHLFNTDQISVDTSVFNAARLIKLWGTMARKGDDTVDRPHRRSCLLHVPDKIETVTVDQLQWLAAQAPDTTPQRKEVEQTNQRQYDDSGQLDVQAYLAHYGVQVVGTRRNGSSTLYLLEHCLFDQTHTAKESAIGQGDNGALFYWCFHNSCQGRTWHEARRLISGDDSLAPFMPGMARKEHQKAEQPTTPPPDQGQLSIWDGPVDLPSLIDIEPAPISWFAKDRIIRGRGFVITGVGGSSKTRMLYHLGAGSILGRLPWGWTINQTGRSILVLTEDVVDDLHRTIHNLCLSLELSYEEKQQVYHSIIPYPLAGEDIKLLAKTQTGTLHKSPLFHSLSKKVQDLGDIAFIGLDPALSLTDGDELDQGNQRALGKMADDLAVQTGAACALVTHATKGSLAKDELTSHNSRGGGAITDAVRAEFVMRTMTSKEAIKAKFQDPEERFRHVQLVGTKGNYLPPDAYIPVWLRRDQYGMLHEAELSFDEEQASSKDMEALDILKDIAKTTSPPIKDWRQACVDAGVITAKTDGAQVKEIDRIKNKLKKLGYIKQGHGRGIWLPVNEDDFLDFNN